MGVCMYCGGYADRSVMTGGWYYHLTTSDNMGTVYRMAHEYCSDVAATAFIARATAVLPGILDALNRAK